VRCSKQEDRTGRILSLDEAVCFIKVGDGPQAPINSASHVEDLATWLEHNETIDALVEAPTNEHLGAIVDGEGKGLGVWTITKQNKPFRATKHVRCTCQNHLSIETMRLLCTKYTKEEHQAHKLRVKKGRYHEEAGSLGNRLTSFFLFFLFFHMHLVFSAVLVLCTT
jgi:hypothetical protein